jgi:hypothetical protein
VDRLFLDANVLFSAAYRKNAGLTLLWGLKGAILMSSTYAIEEARVDLQDGTQRSRLAKLVSRVEMRLFASFGPLPAGIDLPWKDRPILLGAIAAQATHLISGDKHILEGFSERQLLAY